MNINLYRFEVDSNDEFNLEKLIDIEKITDCSQKTTPLPDIIKSSSGDILYHKHIEEIELNDKKYISTIISGNYTHNSPEWEYLAEKSIFNKTHLSPFCIIFLYSKDTPKIIWAYCYGAGYRILKKNMSTKDYGQKIALDSIDNERITLLERTNLINKTTSKILRGGNSRDHKYDMNSELISSIGGKAKYNKDKIKESFYGSNNFKTKIEATSEKFEDDIKNLIKHCTEYELIYRKEYKHNDLNYFYPTSKEEKEQLNKILTKNMQKGSSSRLTFDITYPQDLHNLVSDGDLISKAVIKTPCKNTNHKIHELDIQNIEDLSLKSIRKFLNDKRKNRKNNPYTTDNIPEPCLDSNDVNIKEIEIEIHMENEGKKVDSIPLFNWLCGSYDIRKNSGSLEKGMYYLDNGTWKKPSKEYKQVVIDYFNKYNNNNNEYMRNILEQTAIDSVRQYEDKNGNTVDKTKEDVFNASLVKILKNDPKFCSKEISILDIGAIGSAGLDIGENSKMEISDVYINKGTYIYVKNHADSNTVSHLINQSYMSAKYMQYSPNYKNILDKLKDMSGKGDSNKITVNSDFKHVKESDLHIKEFILVLIVDRDTRSKKNEKKFPLTLRAQIPLYQHIVDLESMGIKVSLLTIIAYDAIEKYEKNPLPQ